MDKVQVDVKKLQLLNDRICQTIDALNQVRLTAQQAGLFGAGTTQFSAYGQTPVGYNAFTPNAYGVQHSSAIDPMIAARQTAFLGTPWYGQMPVNFTPGVYGFQHTTAIDPVIARQAALACAPCLGQQVVPSMPVGITPSIYGFQHTTGIDPTLAARQAALVGGSSWLPYSQLTGFNPSVYGMQHSNWIDPNLALRQATLGGFDPSLRSIDMARACEANRQWELTQGLSHTSVPSTYNVGLNSPFLAGYVPCAGFVC